MPLELEDLGLVIALQVFGVFTDIRQESFRAEDIGQHVGFLSKLVLGRVQPRTHEDDFIAVLLQRLFSDVLPKLFFVEDLDSQLFDHLELPVDVLLVRPVGRNFTADQSTSIGTLLVDMHVFVAQPAKEGSTGQ